MFQAEAKASRLNKSICESGAGNEILAEEVGGIVGELEGLIVGIEMLGEGDEGCDGILVESCVEIGIFFVCWFGTDEQLFRKMMKANIMIDFIFSLR